MKNDEKKEREKERERGGGEKCKERDKSGRQKSSHTIHKEAALWYMGKIKYRYVSFWQKVCVCVVCRKAASHIAFSDHTIRDYKPKPML